VKLHTKKLKIPKMTRRKLQSLELQNYTKVKKIQNLQEEKQMSPLPPYETSHKKI
jgi:reverse gyrase